MPPHEPALLLKGYTFAYDRIDGRRTRGALPAGRFGRRAEGPCPAPERRRNGGSRFGLFRADQTSAGASAALDSPGERVVEERQPRRSEVCSEGCAGTSIPGI